MSRDRPDYILVKREARSLLDRYGYAEPPINPVVIARQEGISVQFFDFSGEYDGVSGFYDPLENRIYINKHEYPLRQTFTVAHELGHAKLHRAWAESDDYKLFWRDTSLNDRNDPYEKEANAFAANLLVPRNMLDQYYRDYSLETLSRLFAVSVPTIRNRIEFEYGVAA